jgi:SAM-dependent methyltransferase
MSDKRNRDGSWDRYWDHGFVTSCSSAFDGNYEGPIRSAWQDFLAAVPVGGRVLDICTGNGAVALIASEVSRTLGLELEIHGIDSAAIRPLETVPDGRRLLGDIRFHPETAAEQTPFPDRHFQAITGQYAFEYTDEARCIEELARITAPGGRLMFIVHHADSIVMRTTREEIRNAAIIFEETRIFDRARDIIDIVGRTRSPADRAALGADPHAEQARQGLNAAAERLSAALAASPHPELLQIALNRVAEAYRMLGSEGHKAALARLADSRRELQANLERLHDLMGAARDADQIDRICEQMSNVGFRPRQPVPVRHDNARLMGWQVQARRITD